MADYVKYPKIPRLVKDVIVTEKIDGTNAQVCFLPDGQGGSVMTAGSRNRELVSIDFPGTELQQVRWHGNDNYNFGQWVVDNCSDLRKLGYGNHYGEWWGLGIQRGYNMKEKVFSLFKPVKNQPDCCRQVPVLATIQGFDGINSVIQDLKENGSEASPGFMDPEGVIAFHCGAGQLFKFHIRK